MSLLKPAWDNATNPDRADLVFERRNREYGAYPIRKGYTRTIASALLASVVIFGAAVGIPQLLKMFGDGDAFNTDKPVEVTVELKEPPPIDKNEPPPPPPPPPPPTIETVKFTPPVVVDRELEEEEQPPPQEELSETNVGQVTQEGDENATELPPSDPVVADPDEGKIFMAVEEPPSFPGGEAAMYRFLQENIKYPPVARENNITGRVFLTFIVNREGKISDIKILRDIGGGCGQEAVRVVGNMPSWKPGKQNGRPVNVQFNMPINFTLK